MTLSPYLHFARSLILRDRPVYAHFAVTDRCDLRCRACSIWQRHDSAKKMDLPQIRRLAAMLGELGCVSISLGGGEPCLRKDLPEIVEAFEEQKIRTRVLTNGVAMTPDRAQALIDAGLAEFSFSIDSFDPAIQEALDGKTGTYSTRVNNLIALAQMLPRSGAISILNSMVTSQNIDQLPKVVELAQALGFFASFIPLHLADESQATGKFHSDDKELAFNRNDAIRVQNAFDELIALKKSGAPIVNSTSFLEGGAQYLLEGRAPWKCLAGELYISIGPNGMVAPCHRFEGQWEVPFEKFPEWLQSKTYLVDLRGKVASCEGCFRPCWTEVSYMMTDARSFREMAMIQWRRRKKRPEIDPGQIRNRFFPEAEI